jgi:hypothetical protein
LKRQLGHCQVPCRQTIVVGHRQHLSASLMER